MQEETPSHGPNHAPAPRSHRTRRFLGWGIGVLIVTALLIAGLVYALATTEWGARTFLQNVSRFLPGELSGEVVSGSLDKGLTLRNVRYRDDQRNIAIDRLRAKWELPRSPLKLNISSLDVGTVEIRQKPTPDEPPTPPQQLTLPFALQVQDASIEKIIRHSETETGKTETTVYQDIRLRGRSDSVQHEVHLEKATTPFGKVQASINLNGRAPFNISGTANVEGSVQGQPYKLHSRLSGTLQSLGIKLNARGEQFSGEATVNATPFDPVPLRDAKVQIQDLNPNAFNPAWPKANLQVDAAFAPVDSAGKSGLTVRGPLSVNNTEPGAIDQGLLPLESLQAEATLDQAKQQLSNIKIQLAGKGVLQGSGSISSEGNGELTLEADQVNLQALHSALRQTELSGPLHVELTETGRLLTAKLADSSVELSAKVEQTPKQTILHHAELEAGSAQLKLQGKLENIDQASYLLEGKLTDFNPALFLANVRTQPKGTKGKSSVVDRIEADINMTFEAQGVLEPVLTSQIKFDIDNSTYNQRPMTGGGFLHIKGKNVTASDAKLVIAGNRLSVHGSFGEPNSKLVFDLNAPSLARLGFGLSGLAKAEGSLQGTLDKPQIAATFRAENLSVAQTKLNFLSGKANIGGLPDTAPNAGTDLDMTIRGLKSNELSINSAEIDIDGTYSDHTIKVQTSGLVRKARMGLSATATGRLISTEDKLAWAGKLLRLENEGAPRIAMSSPLPISITPDSLSLGATQLSFGNAKLELEHLQYTDRLVQSEGSFNRLQIAQVLDLYRQVTGQDLPIGSNLVLDGKWDLKFAQGANNGYVEIERRSGDIRVQRGTGKIALGLETLALRAELDNKRMQFTVKGDANRIGTIASEGTIGLDPSAQGLPFSPESSISAQVKAAIPKLQRAAVLTGPATALEGSVEANLDLAGTLGDVRVAGTVAAEGLGVTLYDYGLRLGDGVARIKIANDVAQIEEFYLKGGEGILRATGRIPLDSSDPNISATLVADNLQLLASPAGRMTISGKANVTNVNQQPQVAGNFVVDRALFTLPEKRAPELGDDVIVLRDGKPIAGKSPTAGKADEPAGAFTPRVEIAVDLGNQFLFEGSGADLRLAGTLKIVSEPGEELEAYGTVRVVEGTYEAFGTELAIERGVLNFNGSISNPNVNLRAMRRGQEVAAGVQVTGTVKQPRIQLVSEPDLSQEEKLSWLLFGKSGGGADPGQAQAAVSGAALGLLNKLGGERIAGRLGLDELSIGESEFGLKGQQVVNLGKEITDRLFIGFEQSLTDAASVLKITYELSQHWSVVLRGGEIAGIDLTYTIRFNNLFGSPKRPAGTKKP